MGRDSRNRPANASSFNRRSWRTEGGEEEEDKAQKEVRQMASSERRRGRLGDVAGRENGEGSPTDSAWRWGASGGVGLHTAHCAAQGEERVRD